MLWELRRRRNSLLPLTNCWIVASVFLFVHHEKSTHSCVNTNVALPKNRKHHSISIYNAPEPTSIVSLILVQWKNIMLWCNQEWVDLPCKIILGIQIRCSDAIFPLRSLDQENEVFLNAVICRHYLFPYLSMPISIIWILNCTTGLIGSCRHGVSVSGQRVEPLLIVLE
jgi:hypothetical protein